MRGARNLGIEAQAGAADVVILDVADASVVGLLARPAAPGPFPAVVAFGGSGGGLGPASAWAPALASHGFAVLAIAYFGVPGLPDELVDIEVEVVERAVAWLADAGDVDGETVGVMGMSRGSELALLASVLLDGVGPVVAFSPSGVVWSGLGTAGPVDRPAWTFRGEAIAYAHTTAASELLRPPAAGAPPLALRPMFDAALADPARWCDAEIAVEHAKGPILLVSGEDDAMWPATTMATMIERRAAERAFPHEVAHLHYPAAGHTGAGVPGFPAETDVLHPLTGGRYALGGTAAGNAGARAHSWPRVVSFLTDALPAR